MNMAQKKSGFTIVELLVVILIIGILVFLVVVATTRVRNRSHNVRIKNDTGQLRLMAEQVFDSNGARYVDWTKHPQVAGGVAQLLTDIADVHNVSDALAEKAVLVETQNKHYCISVELKVEEEGLTHYCVDKSGQFKGTDRHCDVKTITSPDDQTMCP